MTINKKLVTLLVCAVVMTVGAISATMAYFTDSEQATNTFTVGHVDITLDEAKVDELGTPIAGADRVTENEYKLIPGSTYLKDPTVHVTADSDDCWLFVTVDNQIEALEGGKTIATQMAEKGWTQMGMYKEVPLYKYADIVHASDDIIIFGEFTIDGETTDKIDLQENKDSKITVIAYAIQAAGFDSAEAAWEAAKSQLK